MSPAIREPGLFLGSVLPQDDVMTMDEDLHTRINELVAEEHTLRAHADITEDDRSRLAGLEVALDQAWDLLRQRQARRDVGQDPTGAAERDGSTVESYLG
jgi:hypothetical protein